MKDSVSSIKMFAIQLISMAVLWNLVGCSTPSFLRSDLTTFGPRPLIKPESFEKLDISLVLNPSGEPIEKGDSSERIREKIEIAFFEFYKNPIDQKNRRNRIQERILSASEQRCGEYKNFLKQFESGTNFFLGSTTTAIAGAGAIFTGIDAVRALSGTAAIVSGIRSEFNEDYFSNQTIQVLTSGFESKREELYEKMLARSQLSIGRYPLEAAVKDAVKYHASCSLIAGLEQAALAIQRTKNPGLIGTQKALIEAKKLQHIMNTNPGDISKINLSNPVGLPSSGITTLATMDNLIDDELPQGVYAKVRANVALLDKDFKKTKKKLLAEAYKEKTNELSGLGQIVEKAIEETKDVLQQQAENEADAITTTIRKTQATIVETINPDLRGLLEIELAKQMLDGMIVIQEIRKIHLVCHSNYTAAESALRDNSISELDTRLEKAVHRLHQIIITMIGRKLDTASKLMEVKFKKLAPADKLKLIKELEIREDIGEGDGKVEILNLIKQKKSELEKLTNQYSQENMDLMDAASKVADKIRAACQ